MIRVLVYEFASCGGFGNFGDAPPPPSILAEGRAMRDALLADLAGAAGVEAVAAAPRTDESAGDYLVRAAREVDAIFLIAPESEGIAAALTRRVEAGDATLLGSSADAVAFASSKSRCLARLAAAGIATAPTWRLDEAPLERHDTWVLKPDMGCGCEDMRRLPADAARRLRATAPAATLAQPWLAGEPMSLSLLVGREVELLAVNRQHIAVAADGALSLAGISRHLDVGRGLRAQLAALARRAVAAVPGLAGFVGIDFVLSPAGQPIVLELNPRLTSAYVGLSARLGRNLAGEIVAAFVPRESYRG